MDGFQVLEQLKADPQLRDLPVIVTSSVEGVANIVRCIELGAEDYLPKPVNPVLLKARIGASLEKKRLRDQQKELVRRFATSEVAQDLAAVGLRARRQARAGYGDVLRHPRLHALVESQPPEETIELLNTYYTLMFDAISGHGGVVNQMIGDGLMAIFGAPLPLADHCAARGARGAGDDRDDRALQRRARRRGQGRRSRSASASPPARWWPATPARRQRATYTCIGDTVNLAARLEAHTKVAQRAILIDDATRAALGDAAPARGAGRRCRSRARRRPVEVFAVGPGQKF